MPLLIAPRVHDIGFSVRRLLPSRACQRVGPFIFVDHMGPARFEKHSTAGDVRQHPHIGLATVTYLFTGAMMHRDSLGSLQRIEPGAINLMTAGRGIVHSERIPEDVREAQEAVQGIQTWLALPLEDEQIAPMFEHYPADAIPGSQVNGGQLRVLIGRLEGLESPVKTCSTTTYLELQLDPEGVFELTLAGQELAVYLVQGGVQVNGEHVPEHHLLVAGDSLRLQAGAQGCRAMILGGEPLEGKRFMHWNFVASSTQRLKQAASDWEAGRFTAVPGETEFIPLPD